MQVQAQQVLVTQSTKVNKISEILKQSLTNSTNSRQWGQVDFTILAQSRRV